MLSFSGKFHRNYKLRNDQLYAAKNASACGLDEVDHAKLDEGDCAQSSNFVRAPVQGTICGAKIECKKLRLNCAKSANRGAAYYSISPRLKEATENGFSTP